MDCIPRTAVDGIVRDPLSGAVEFASTDQGLAEKVAATLDEHQPVTAARLFELLDAMPRGQRVRAEWVLSFVTWTTLRRHTRSSGSAMAMRSVSPQVPDRLLGLPVVFDDNAVGITLRMTTDVEDLKPAPDTAWLQTEPIHNTPPRART